MQGEVSDITVADGGSDEALSKLAVEILESLRSLAVIDWRKKAEVQREMRRAIKKKLRTSYAVPADQVEPVTLVIMDLARVHLN